ncbi:hypothetical protein L485_12355 [Sphingobium baderi LL03]|uniref:Uncharacterized protein n=1 Tax=Sphingobium baderi LL03 TaxID=1114964 RepID=T0GL38_9SPHN|nr:hypothetical protein L485_12355 [Sphingobium baderi LL03]
MADGIEQLLQLAVDHVSHKFVRVPLVIALDQKAKGLAVRILMAIEFKIGCRHFGAAIGV